MLNHFLATQLTGKNGASFCLPSQWLLAARRSCHAQSKWHRHLLSGHNEAVYQHPVVLLQAGFEWEVFKVTTDDGYILDLHRIPKRNSRQAVLFVHGVMDTALGWVNTSLTHSLAYSARDRNYDVWLASCRNNPPRKHTDAKTENSTFAYFSYTVNQLAQQDLRAQV